jgi:molybdopterin synthase sulfur carrier subunit
MKLRVRLFAVAKDLAARDELTVEAPDGATVADVRRIVAAEYPVLSNVLPHALWAVDAAYSNDDTPLNEKSDIALIPPVSGG